MLQNLVIGTSSALIFRSRNRKVKSEFSGLVRELFSASRIEFQGSRVQDPGSNGPGGHLVPCLSDEAGLRVADMPGFDLGLFPDSIYCFLST